VTAALRGFSALQIILTHEHADAVLGLDEVWVVQPRNGRNDIEQIPIFLTQFTMDRFTFTSCFLSALMTFE
jgi:ribonuclease BN (tRNA processing enzyme)